MPSTNIYASDKAHPYVYMVTNRITKEFYIGYRCANKYPSSMDIGVRYFTSSKLVKPRFNEFDVCIIAEFLDKESAIDFESGLIKEHWYNPLLLNQARHTSNLLKKRNFDKVSKKARERMLTNNPAKTPEVRLKMSLSMTGRKHSEETKVKMSMSRKGVRLPKRPEQSIRQIGVNNPNAYTFVMITPDDDVLIIREGLKNFCKTNNIPLSGMYELTSGKRDTYRGWLCVQKFKS